MEASSSGFVDNWQTGKTVTECNVHMLTTEDCSDVIFRVGSEKHVVRAHRYVLVSRSCVFHAMFCGPLAEKGEVTVPDIESHVFKEFLRYLYTDSASITANNVSGLLYTSRKYSVDVLLDKCTQYLEKSLSEENVCQILEQYHIYGEMDLERKAYSILNKASEKVIKSSGFLDLCSDCLVKFIKSDQLQVNEEQIFEAIFSWTKRVCEQEDIPCTHENIRRILGDMVYEIRFSNMSWDFLVNVVGQTEVLSETERFRIMDSFIRPSLDISPFKSADRKMTTPTDTSPSPSVPRQFFDGSSQSESAPGTKNHSNKSEVHRSVQYVHRFQGNCVWWMPHGTHAISLSVSKNIHLMGCQMYGHGKDTRECFIGVDVLKTDDQTMLRSFTKTTSLRGGRRLNDIMFPGAVLLKAGCSYTICVTIRGTCTWCGTRGRRFVVVDGVTFAFYGSPMSKTTTRVSEGQIPGLIFMQMLQGEIHPTDDTHTLSACRRG